MRNKQPRRLGLVTLALITLLAVRCGGGTPELIDIDRAATQTSIAIVSANPPTATNVPTPTGTASAAETFTFRGLDVSAFESYEMSMHIVIKDADGVEAATIQLDVQASATNALQQMTRTGALDPGVGVITTVYVGGVTYITDGVHCDAARGDTEGMLAVGPGIAEQLHIFNPSELSQTELGGEINGVATTKYHADLQHPDLTAAGADVWVADDGGHIVRWRMSGSGDLSEFEFGVDVGALTMEFNLLSTNQALDIQVPPECDDREPEPPPAG